MRSPRRTTLPLIGLLAAVYFVIGKLSLQLAFLNASASAVWPPAGLAIAALLLLGYRVWPAILIGAFLVNATTAGNTFTSISIAVGNTLEALCAAALTNRFAGGVQTFERADSVFKFAFAAMLGALISATLGVTSLATAGFAQWSTYFAVWLTWWLGDATGALVVAPLLILWATKSDRRLDRKDWLEAGALLVLLVLLAEIVFGGWFPISANNYPVSFICGPVVIWMAFRFAPREAATGIFVLSAIAIWGTLHHFGPFVTGSENQSLLILQNWTGVLALTALALSAGMAERKRAELAIAEQQTIVESANRTKDKFLAMLSHELRTPLTPVLAAVETLENAPAGSQEAQSALRMIRRNVELERHLIDDLLDLTRIAREKLQLQLARIDAHAAVLNVIDICRAQANERQINVEIALAAERHEIEADEAKFQQIVWNLLNNAIKFTARCGKITISSANPAPDSLVIAVRDNGIGIEAEILPHIFDPFEQGERSLQRRFGGLGLGLAIAKSLAEAHGGTLVAQSEGRGRGAEFSLTMKTAGAVEAAEPQLAVDKPPARRDLRILLVDDHADTCAALARLLSARGHSVVTAQDSGEAIRAAERDEFDLLISDIGLPDCDGMELLRQVRAKAPIRAIAISGFGMSSDVEKSLRAGFSEHLVKPLNIEKLDAAIRSAMNSAPAAA